MIDPFLTMYETMLRFGSPHEQALAEVRQIAQRAETRTMIRHLCRKPNGRLLLKHWHRGWKQRGLRPPWLYRSSNRAGRCPASGS